MFDPDENRRAWARIAQMEGAAAPTPPAPGPAGGAAPPAGPGAMPPLAAPLTAAEVLRRRRAASGESDQIDPSAAARWGRALAAPPAPAQGAPAQQAVPQIPLPAPPTGSAEPDLMGYGLDGKRNDLDWNY